MGRANYFLAKKSIIMKSIKLFLIFVSFSTFLSCMESRRSIEENSRKDIIGNWTITKKSLEKMESRKDGNKIIRSFKLNADSTVKISYGSFEKEKVGKWKWKAEKEFGNDNFGIGFYSDVVIRANATILGLSLNSNQDNMILQASDYSFKKEN